MASTVIVGAGIIGVSTAYYLSQSTHTSPESIHLIDTADDLFHCSSGFAGGFLAEDWFAPSVAPLGKLSFRLHRELAAAHDGATHWGYSRSTALSLSSDSESAIGGSGEDWLRDGSSRARAAAETQVASGVAHGDPAWLTRGEGASVEVISAEGTVAQIDPLRLCHWLLKQCVERGVKVHHPARAFSVAKDLRDTLASVRILENGVETDLPCNRLIITAGAWTPQVFGTLFPDSPIKIPVGQLAGHALLVRSPRWSKPAAEEDQCHAVFATETLGFSPELFSRRRNEIYLAGLNSTTIKLPNSVNEVQVSDASVEQLKAASKRMLGLPEGEDDVEVLKATLCFRPVTSNGRPILCKVPDRMLGDGIWTRGGGDGGVFISAGHGAWGISQCLGTGLVLSELIEGRKPSVNIEALALAT